jgi:probable rRNA maturation factor
MQVSLVNQSEVSMPKKFTLEVLSNLEKLLAKKHPHLKCGDLTVVFLNPIPAKKLNKIFRGRNYATDILSFASGVKLTRLQKQHFFPFGELVLCPEVLKKQAKDHELSFKAEYAYMLIHGVLHLLGYDHEGEGTAARRKAQVMFKLQDQLFDRLRKKYDF